MNETIQLIEETFEVHAGRVLASLIKSLNDFDLAEDVLQEAMLAAMENWPKDGVPPNPVAWLTLTARRKAIDRLRRAKTYQRKIDEMGTRSIFTDPINESDPDSVIPDERLKLIFTCCHPSLNLGEQVALTLKSLMGLPIEGIARIYLVSKSTMAQRLVRAKRKLRMANAQFHVPPADEMPERVRAVQYVIYSIFSECYSPSKGSDVTHDELCQEGVTLGRLLVSLLEKEGLEAHLPESLGLLALMLLHDARRAARRGDASEIVLLEDQDRSLWDQVVVAEGKEILERALLMNSPGQFQIQAAIIAVHTEAEDYASTDWPQILALYTELYRLAPMPVVKLNRAVALAMLEGPQAGLDILDEIEEEGNLKDHMFFFSTRADLFRRLGQWNEALENYKIAISMTDFEPEIMYFERRIKEVEMK